MSREVNKSTCPIFRVHYNRQAQVSKEINFLALKIIPDTYGACAITRIQTRKDTASYGYASEPVVRGSDP